MDAKPQRPLRALAAASGDENIIAARQSVHPPHKPAANPKAMTATAVLNAPPKRTAFGDVSNTARGRAGNYVGKPVGKDVGNTRPKSVVTAVGARNVRAEDKENRKSAANETRAKPAAAHKRDIGNGFKSHPSAPLQAANASQRVILHQQHVGAALAQPPLRNGVSKKPTYIYQDREELRVNAYSTAQSPADDIAILTSKPIKSPRHYKSQPVLRTEQQSLRQVHAKFVAQSDKAIEAAEEEDIDDNATEAAYEDAVEQLSHDTGGDAGHSLIAMEQVKYKALGNGAYNQLVSLKTHLEPPVASEPEEYWDEEEEQELYEDQGCITAHSFRSHGDNDTNDQTALVAPAFTADVRAELEMAKAYVAEHQTQEELDEGAWDVSLVAEYGDEIFEYMLDLEMRMCPNPHYMDDQPEIQWSMRSVLLDWLIQVHHRFCLLPETLFLAVNCIDRFLSAKVVSLGKLQLVGATALFIAAKYEEINCPSVQEIVYMVDQGYTVDEILKAERFMLSMLNFELGWPGPMSFLRRISKADDYDLLARTMAKYFLEVAIMDERLVSCPPSYLAAGALCISRLILKMGGWTPAHVHYSGYTLGQLKPLVKVLYDCCWNPHKHHLAVLNKYRTPKYMDVAGHVEDRVRNYDTLSEMYVEAAKRDNPCHTDDDDSDA